MSCYFSSCGHEHREEDLCEQHSSFTLYPHPAIDLSCLSLVHRQNSSKCLAHFLSACYHHRPAYLGPTDYYNWFALYNNVCTDVRVNRPRTADKRLSLYHLSFPSARNFFDSSRFSIFNVTIHVLRYASLDPFLVNNFINLVDTRTLIPKMWLRPPHQRECPTCRERVGES